MRGNVAVIRRKRSEVTVSINPSGRSQSIVIHDIASLDQRLTSAPTRLVIDGRQLKPRSPLHRPHAKALLGIVLEQSAR